MNGPSPDRPDPAGTQPVINFNVGTVHGSNYNVVGDVYVGATPVPVHEIPGRLRAGLRRAPLGGSGGREAGACVDDIDDAMRADAPDRDRIARSLERLTRLLSTTGTLVAAGAALVDPMTGLAVWLGELGRNVLQDIRNA